MIFFDFIREIGKEVFGSAPKVRKEFSEFFFFTFASIGAF